ncbi:MAG: glycosyltransferase family 39 protein [Deltaproteobacteria bacterium]|nr:glycosyltransferase family 39 protein [Deltaproteobacteria bacterium]
MAASKNTPRPRATEPDPFHFVDDPRTLTAAFTPSFFLLWALVLTAFYFAVNAFIGDFAGMTAYGVNDEHRNWIFQLTKKQVVFAVTLLALLPAAGFIGFATRETIGRRLYAAAVSVMNDKAEQRRLLIAMIGAGTLAVAAVANFVMDNTPISDDERAYVFQSRILASGRLTLPSLPEPYRKFEDNVFLVNNGRRYAQYPFGHSIFLLPGVIAGYPRLMIFLAAALTLWGVIRLGKELDGPATGYLAGALVLLSPMFLTMSATLLSHPACLLFLTWFGYFMVRTMRGGTLREALACGLCFGAAFHIRSATAILVAGPAAFVLAATMLFDWKRESGSKLPRPTIAVGKNLGRIMALALSVGGLLAIYLTFNLWVNGSLSRTNYHAAWQGNTPFTSPFGFFKGAWNIVHTPKQGWANLFHNLLKLNTWSLGWPISFLPVLAWLAIRGKRAWEWLLFLPIVLTFAAYLFYFWPGISDTGPVLYYELLLPIALLAAIGLRRIYGLLAERMDAAPAGALMASTLAAASVLGLLTVTQTHLRALNMVTERVRQPDDLIELRGIDHGVIFTNYYVKDPIQDSWVAGRPDTSPLLGDKLHFALNFGASEDRAFMQEYFPDQPAYVVWWEETGPRLVPLADYDDDRVVKNYREMR